jgi:hypothetical protein
MTLDLRTDLRSEFRDYPRFSSYPGKLSEGSRVCVWGSFTRKSKANKGNYWQSRWARLV